MRTANGSSREIHFSVCICTRNRPDELSRALQSLTYSQTPIFEVIVSDDSTDTRTKQLLQSHFPSVRYLAGPKRGLSANRNHAILAASGTHLLFIDDDVILSSEYFGAILKAIKENEERYGERLIITGLENNKGSIIYPHEQSFLGFQKRSYKAGDKLKTIVINSCVFPTRLFKEILFDEQLIYGYEEVDIATRAVQVGYPIILAADAVNAHEPSEINRDYYRPYLEKSRIYVTLKRYLLTERKWLKSLSFLVLAFVHTLFHGMKSEGLKGAVKSVQSANGSISMIVRRIRDNRSGAI